MTLKVINSEIPPEVENYMLCSQEPCILEKLMSKRGQIASVTYNSELVPRKNFKDKGIKGHRIVHNRLMRVGINYENLTSTKEIRESGIEKSGLKGSLSWIKFPYLLKNKDNELFFRFYPFGNNEPKVQYFMNDEIYDWGNLSEIFLASGQFSGHSKVVNLKLENIIEVK